MLLTINALLFVTQISRAAPPSLLWRLFVSSMPPPEVCLRRFCSASLESSAITAPLPLSCCQSVVATVAPFRCHFTASIAILHCRSGATTALLCRQSIAAMASLHSRFGVTALLLPRRSCTAALLPPLRCLFTTTPKFLQRFLTITHHRRYSPGPCATSST